MKFANSTDRKYLRRVLMKVKGGHLKDGAAAYPFPNSAERILQVTSEKLQACNSKSLDKSKVTLNK